MIDGINSYMRYITLVFQIEEGTILINIIIGISKIRGVWFNMDIE